MYAIQTSLMFLVSDTHIHTFIHLLLIRVKLICLIFRLSRLLHKKKFGEAENFAKQFGLSSEVYIMLHRETQHL